ncbi:MAG: hypothetical protein PVI11_04925 [Candidatus Aminicenantes bacterium]|jgi:purine-nucleoside phosphorylase
MNNESIVKPPPYKGFSKNRVVCVPADTPSRFIFKSIQKQIRRKQTKPFGQVFQLNDKIILYQCVGSPTTVMALERLIASGAREILFLGFCGSLSLHTKTLDAVSITKAYSQEGTSKHYFPQKKIFYPSLKMREKIENTLKDLHLPFKHGAIVSTDAPFRETKTWLRDNQRRHIGCVDMETSAVFALASFYGLRAAALMLVSDELCRQEHKIDFHQPKTETCMKHYFLPFLLEA